jgi:Cof subfamily protein (haloacid dehalogenase superfamily)
MIRLIGLDLDGTVFDNRKHISERTVNAVGQAAARGVFVVPVTGRPFHAIPESVRTLPGIRYISSASGASVIDLAAGKKIHEDLIENARAAELLRRLADAGFVAMAFIEGMGYVRHEDLERAVGFARDEIARHYLRTTRKGVPDLPSYIRSDGRGVEKFTVSFAHDRKGRMEGIEGAERLLSDCSDLDIVCGGPIDLEATNRTATKGNALHFLADRLGIRREEIMACGDSVNDLEMLQSVGLPVAMGNADEKLKEAASWITDSNEEDGAAKAIEKFALGD